MRNTCLILNNTGFNVTRLAIALFEKRASHIVFLKESKAKEKFDKLTQNKSNLLPLAL